MRKIISVILGVSFVGFGGYLYFLTEKLTLETVDESYVESDIVKTDKWNRIDGELDVLLFDQKSILKANEINSPVSHVELQKMSQKVVVYREKIEDLILQFDSNLSDPTARKNIKQEIDAEMSSYNEMVLPVVMSMMKDTGQK